MSARHAAPLLETRELSYLYRARARQPARGLRSLNLKVSRGEVVGLLGPNGAGKSTAFELISGERRAQRGEVLFKGQALGALPLWRRARLGLAYLSQRPAIFERLSALENLSVTLSWSPLSQGERVDLAHDILSELGLSTLAQQPARLLSGGERQRLAIGMLMALRPELVLLDEPFAALDPRALDAMREVIFMLKERGVGLLMTDHRAEQTLSLCDRVYILSEGELIASGSPDEVQDNPEVQAIYLGSEKTVNRSPHPQSDGPQST